MSATVAARGGRRAGWLVRGVAVMLLMTLIGVGVLALLIARPGLPLASSARSAPATRQVSVYGVSVPPFPNRPTGPAWDKNVAVTVPLQQVLERLPEGGPYVMRVTELEMEPGTRIFEHRQIGPGAHVVLDGEITIEDIQAGSVATYRAGQAYYEGMDWLHRAVNRGIEANRVMMVDILPASRGFDGQQQFTERGRHNEGELRSGPYVQIPLTELPESPLMLRVTDMEFGPKAKTEEHVRVGPSIFYVAKGTATIRKDWDNSSATYGTNGYFFESGQEPFILENKPARPARFIAIELLPASLGDAPSTIPTDQ
ncbi:MAG: hypothetical protein M3O34_15105 [Chloroflexota bacterium]|nr:hypothetical protein [Chloroflexota bacterium]